MAETKENWKQASFWITPGLMIALATLAYTALDDVRDDLHTALDGVRDDLSAQIRQTEARLDKKIDSLKEDVDRNTDEIKRLRTQVDRILGHLMGPADRDG